MNKIKKEHPKEKTKLHPRSKHRERYDFKLLIESSPELAHYVKVNEYGDESIDFFNPDAVKALNTALLKHFYGIEHWDIPADYLCPPIPGRADYIHNVADLLGTRNNRNIPTGNKIKVLDIGTGANLIYPILGSKEYGWSFTGSETDPVALASANKIIESNPSLKGKIELRLQKSDKDIFHGVIKKNEIFDLTICNPPFHASLEEAQSGTLRKLKNLKPNIAGKPVLNFGGNQNELWCRGGEKRFVGVMIRQSQQFANSCFWFSTLIAKEANLDSIYDALERAKVMYVKTIHMGQGNKKSRIVAWTFLTKEKQQAWIDERWNETQ
ncbi:MAG: 23S rRNA (adenine(1618)-N(6))-methyltransferase RlmF [Bacteroidales bacterium]|nr:23S rRNA (adenine(1618)-N(6))-methyltransferase RlmF [Bacteroidales bacterium]MCF8458229.1 23S rRNA (adenine(1618)-N(6))-methyltransferase RlmF [Bacteroidales bacterium]